MTNDAASHAMLSAALGGLLSLGATGGCVFSVSETGSDTSGAGPTTTGATSTTAASTTSTGGAGGAGGATGATSTSSDASSTTASTVSASSSTVGTATASTGTGTTNPHTPIPNTACPDGILPNPMVLTTTYGPITQPEFEAMCADAGGIFEIQPLCGGSNACRGFAYDAEPQILTQHSCQHTNTCAGYNCVVCD